MSLDALKVLVERNFEANMQLWRRAGTLLRSARDVSSQPRPRQTELRALGRDLAQLNVDYYARLSDQTVQYLNAIVDIVEEALGPGKPSGGALPPQKGAEIRVSGRIGQTVTTHFQLENPNPQPVNVSFEVGDFVDAAGKAVGQGVVSIDPAALALDANCAPRVVQAHVNVTDAFQPGQTYTCVIRVVGFPMAVRLILAVLAGASGDPQR
jgi:hypothetical protein